MGVKKNNWPLAHKKFRKPHKIVIFAGILVSFILITFSLTSFFVTNPSGQKVLGANITRFRNAQRVIISPVVEITISPSKTPTPTVNPTPTLTRTPTRNVVKPPTPTKIPEIAASDSSQYTAEKIDDTTWKVKNVQEDGSMASPQDIINALNSYRQSRGAGTLSTDSYLMSYAQNRANKFASSGLDGHADFKSFMDNGGFDQAGFNGLGENSAVISGPMSGDKIIRNIFGADPSHDSNQLDSWTHVGVGVNGNAINVNFGRGKR